MKLPTTWILVADRAGARILCQERQGLRQLADLDNDGDPAGLRQLAGRLDRLSAREGFDHLIIVAPPPTLEVLRQALSPAVRAQVHGELGRDLTGRPNAAVASLVADAFVCFAP